MLQEPARVLIQIADNARSPSYATEGAAGADVSACLKEPLELAPGDRVAVPTGLALEIPPGYEIQVRPRSGLALKYGVTVLNSPGTIDSDYRGEIKVILINHGNKSFVIEHGMRIAQLVLSPVVMARFEPQSELAGSTRGSGGFGHTGLT